MVTPRHRVPDQLVPGMTRQPAARLVDRQEAAVLADLRNGDGGILVGRAKASLARPQGGLPRAKLQRGGRERLRHPVDLDQPAPSGHDGRTAPDLLGIMNQPLDRGCDAASDAPGDGGAPG